MDSRLIIFMHIPKTAGTTFRQIIEREYSQIAYAYGGYKKECKNLKEYTESKVKELQCIIGHIPFGVHGYYNRDFHYITLLRNPVERVISLYYYCLQHKNLPNRDIGLEKYLSNYYKQACNLQTKFLSRDVSTADKMSIEEFVKYKTDIKPDLSKAINNLERYFTVGVSDFFAESLSLISTELRWYNTDYKNKNVNSQRPRQTEVSAKIIELVKEKNSLDMELYHYACERLNKC